jgi:hypothetical protein
MTPEMLKIMEAAKAQRWCTTLPDGRCFYFNDQGRAEKFAAKHSGTVRPPL